MTLETDVLVIGGGATGGGIAWDLALRGVRVILAEMGDLATGTSGRYHGLLHSGGRYAVRDPESARECIEENLIVRRVAPEAIEDTSGFFVLCPGDDPSYVDTWLKACAAVNIPTREIPLSEALRRERVLNPRLEAVYEVPDGTCDSWDLLHALQRGAESTGKARFLTYHKVEQFHKNADGTHITGARLRNLRDDSQIDVSCAFVINAAGPWAAEIGALAGVRFGMKLSRGAMLAYNIRWVNTVINKLRMPGDGDIFVPVGTVSVIGTTSVRTDDPGDVRVEPWEIERILDEAEAMTPGISRARLLRAWGGVRPLYDGGSTDGRNVKRTFTALDHREADGLDGLVSIIGGKLTTYRQMAEKVCDLVCARLHVTVPCATAETVLPSMHGEHGKLHHLRGRLDKLEHGETPGALICECEIVTAPQIAEALQRGDVVSLNDLRRDLRLGMGPCQGGFCSYRAAALRHELLGEQTTLERSQALLNEFVERRFGGVKPLLWGHNLRQAFLAEQIYGRILGLFGGDSPQTHVDFSAAQTPVPAHDVAPRIVVIGAGLAGLTAALVAQQSGAHVEIVAQGQGALTLHPGWIETGDVEALRQQDGHPYAAAADALARGLAAIHQVAALHPAQRAYTGTGSPRSIAYSVGAPLPPLENRRVVVVGVRGWRDFFARYAADTLRAQGIPAEAVEIDLPHRGGNFDDWTLDYANYLDTDEGLREAVGRVRRLLTPGIEVAAFPAILGLSMAARQRLAESLGIEVIELPTLTPSVPGLRLYRALRKALLDGGARLTIGTKAIAVERSGTRATGVAIETAAHGRPRLIPAGAVIIATGGLFGGGLESDYKGRVHEPIADLRVINVPPLTEWFPHPLLSQQPQPIHRAGLAFDSSLIPQSTDGARFAENVFAAGRALAGSSPVIEGCTEGVDIATGARAAEGALAAARAFSRAHA
ncbi:anaerobic glycerol-3-phosphate dehydrogenase subunit A [Anaerolineae bacterium CFX9]|nr:anaerobic glycerol-3-phosphate dehydrogenase subunit A [Anaerolineae bacterium CFX9]